ncbi:hypothetical protein D0Z03_002617 [Geotrichum reessii]|nr:hypothetical protein D0Z03_002617 [Galactomyces reessii]
MDIGTILENAILSPVALKALSSSNERVAGSAAQLIAAIADIDLPLNRWPDLMSVLVENTKSENPTHVKKSSLLAIGYICETADPSNAGVVSQASGILTAIVQGVTSDEPSNEVKLTAINALVNSLEFIKHNFTLENERDYIMQVVCEATQSSDIQVQAAAFGALARIMSLYYNFMSLYMEQALFGLTVNGMNSPNDTVACMAVEFWSTVCEEELDRTLNERELEAAGIQVTEPNFHFALYALEHVLPTLLSLLTRQEEDADDDEWSVAMAAGACLQLYAQNTGPSVVAPTLKFVESNLNSSDWKKREASVMAFGSILDGPELDQLNGLIDPALPVFLTLMNDPSPQVRDTVAWCLGKIAYVDGINVNNHLPNLMNALLAGLNDLPKIATNCCWTIMNLTEQVNQAGPDEDSSPLSAYYPQLLKALIDVTARTDNENSSRTSAYEALSSLVIFSARDVTEAVRALSAEVLQRLENTLIIQQQGIVSGEDKTNLEELQINLLGLLTNIIRRLGEDVAPAANRLMELLLNLLQHKFPNSLIDEDVFIAIGSVAGTANVNFQMYMDALLPFILTALNDSQSQASVTVIGLISDISNSLGPAIEAYAETFMKLLGEILGRSDVSREVKRSVLSCFGDIASSMGPSFAFYLQVVMQVISEASSLQVSDESSLEFLDYVTGLKEAVTDAYVGIVTGLHDTPHELLPYLKQIISFLSIVTTDANIVRSDSTVRSIVGLLGDIASMYAPGQLGELYSEPWITEFIRKARTDQSYSTVTRDTARWAREQQKLQVQ